jgi:hypothetical protein
MRFPGVAALVSLALGLGIHLWASSRVGGARAFEKSQSKQMSMSPKPGYSMTSPHWAWISTMAFFADRGGDAAARWDAQHMDNWTGCAPQFKTFNRGMQCYVYLLLWNLIQDNSQCGRADTVSCYYADLQKYLSRVGEPLENAFLHNAGGSPTLGNRLSFSLTPGQLQWAVNPSDPGVIGYNKQRFTNLTHANDGIFIDEINSYAVRIGACSHTVVEFSSCPAYQAALTNLLSTLKAAIPSKRILINTFNNQDQFDISATGAAGGAHLESTNYPDGGSIENNWNYAQQFLDSGLFIDWAVPFGRYATLANLTSTGNDISPQGRYNMLELAGYYMIVPSPPNNLTFDILSSAGDPIPYQNRWFRAIETNIGSPKGPRSLVVSSGKDPVGQPVHIWQRSFTNGLIVYRTNMTGNNGNYTDTSAVAYSLPANSLGRSYTLVRSDGTTIVLPQPTVQLRYMEAVELLYSY